MHHEIHAGNVGTIQWMAPEVFTNQRYRFPADVYSLGMVLYEMETGYVPFQGMRDIAIMRAVVDEKKQPEIPVSANPKTVEIVKRSVSNNLQNIPHQLVVVMNVYYVNVYSCIEWDPDSRSPLNAVMTKLAELLPKSQDEVSEPSFQQHDRCMLSKSYKIIT